MMSSELQAVPTADAVKRQRVEQALLTHPLVDDCVVLVRERQDHQQVLVAYLVCAKPLSAEQLQTHLEDRLPKQALPSAYVPVARLPLTALGQVDEWALCQLEVIDNDLIRQWQDTLHLIPELERAAVVVQEYTEALPRFHLADLLPGWQASVETQAQLIDTLDLDKSQETTLESPLAISAGGDVPEAWTQIKTLAEALRRTAIEVTEKGILYIQPDGSHVFQSYAALVNEAERVLAGLRTLGLQPQDKVIFQLDQNQNFIPAFWGCMLGGFVPVPISTAPSYEVSNNVVNKLHNAWDLLEQPLILTSQELVEEVRSSFQRSRFDNPRLTTIEQLRTFEPDQHWHAGQPDDLAVLIFTSGSTGKPKGVMLSQRNILSNVASSAYINGVSREDISLNWLHLDHVGSLIRCCIRDVFVGCQQIHAPAEAVLENPLRWLDWLERYQVTFAWAPNFALGLINAHAATIQQRQWNLTSVKSLLSVAEAIVPKTAKKFLELLAPHGLSPKTMHAAWGMSETGAAVVFSHEYLSRLPSENAPFVEVGVPVPGLMMRIVNAEGQILHEGATGLLQIKGPMLTCGYYQNQALNQDAFTDDGWFQTGDLGVIRNGRLTVTGRQKDIIIINGLNHYSHEIEAIVESVQGVTVSYTAACAVRKNGIDTDELAIFFNAFAVEGTQLDALLREIRECVARQLQVNPTYLIPVAKEDIPKTAIGKIQRSRLKERFEAGEFDEALKQIDILMGNSNTLPQWFAQKVWQRRETVTRSNPDLSGLTLLFLDATGLGQLYCQQLHQRHQPYISVESGTTFTKMSATRYCIDPTNAAHYRQLLSAILETHGTIAQILHLWTYSKEPTKISSLSELEQAQDKGIYSLLWLVQALNEIQGSQQAVKLLVVSSQAQPTSPQDTVAYEKAPLLGFLKTLAQETAWLDGRHLDLTAEQIDLDAAYVWREMQTTQGQREVAYRQGQRLIPRLQSVDLALAPKQPLPFKQGGLYLLSGGLGDMALAIATYLLEHYHAKLLLLGRTPLPDPSSWHHHLQQDNAISRRIQAYQSLQQLGGETLYCEVDVCDLTGLQQAIAQAEALWQRPLEGVIHLAGVVQERLLVEETRDSLAATLAPKVFGTWTLHQVLKSYPDSLFIHVSSVLAFQGAPLVGAYVAANSFLDHFWHYQNYQSDLKSYCFGSSTWAGVGISRDYEMRQSQYAQGREVMSKEQGLHSFLASLHYGTAHLLVGLNTSHPQIRCHQSHTPLPVQKLHAYIEAPQNEGMQVKLEALRVYDRFGVSSACTFKQLQTLQLTDTGEIDYSQFKANGSQIAADGSPRTDLERRLVVLWQEVLRLPKIGIYDNFFSLGVSSLLAVELFARVEALFGKRLPLSTLFQAATVEALAQLLEQEEQTTLWSSLVPIQPNGTKPPLFAVHELYGDVLYYHPLAQYLGSDQPFYGLQAQGLDGEQPRLNSIEAMASHYIHEMRTLQPEGPYHLLTWSFGGLIALEMAQQLQHQHQQVALLALLDSRSLARYEQWNYSQRLPSYRRIMGRLKHLWKLSHQKRFEYLSWQVDAIAEMLPHSLQSLFKKSGNPSLVPQTSLADTLARHHSALAETYLPTYYAGKITLLNAKEDNEEQTALCALYDETLGWGKLALGGIECYEVPCSHENILAEPHVRVLASYLKACLDKCSALYL